MEEPDKQMQKTGEELIDPKSRASGLDGQLPSTFEIFETDLPVCSNIDQYQVLHYLLDMKFMFNQQIMIGSVILFIKCNGTDTETFTEGQKSSRSVTQHYQQGCPQKITLDACALKISKVSYLTSIRTEPDTDKEDKFSYWLYNPRSSRLPEHQTTPQVNWFTLVPIRHLQFTTSKWCISIYSDFLSVAEPDKQVNVIRIDYQTLPETPSIYWRPTVGYKYSGDNNTETSKIVYTSATPVNNRGLFPCQEAPTAFATWEALVQYDPDDGITYLPLLTSERIGVKVNVPTGNDQHHQESARPAETKYYFYSTHLMPISTFAIILTQFQYVKVISNKLNTPTRLISVTRSNLLDPLEPTLIQYVKNVLHVAQITFGPLPFQRLDLVLMHSSYHTLGLANPHMLFLSPSILNGRDGTQLFYSRIPHEISHLWFGLGIGALDWTEEWLSEGFATFAEDLLQMKVMELVQLNRYVGSGVVGVEELEKELQLKACIRLYTLKNELAQGQVTSGASVPSKKLQVLVPESESALLASETDEPRQRQHAITNGLVPLKQFLQVHYLKGYFFLMYLSSLSGGLAPFLAFLKSYIKQYNGKLVTSKEFVEFYWKETKGSKGTIDDLDFRCEADNLCKDWLYTNELPESLSSVDVFGLIRGRGSQQRRRSGVKRKLEEPQVPVSKMVSPSPLPSIIDVSKCEMSFDRIRHAAESILKGATPASPSNASIQTHSHLSPHELILLFEYLLIRMDRLHSVEAVQVKVLLQRILDWVHYHFDPVTANPDVLHRWCEILLKIVIFRMTTACAGAELEKSCELTNHKALDYVEQYLLQHPAMGLYLYGELMISEQLELQNLARNLYERQIEVFDTEAKAVLKDMIF